MQLPIRFLLIAAFTASTAFASVTTVTIASPITHGAPALKSDEPTSAELALFELSNQDRALAGLPPLRFDHESLAIARARAAAQPTDGSLSHYDASGKMAFADLLSDFGLEFQLAGENLARISGPASAAPDRAQVSLMNSPTHRANILEPSYDLLSVGSTIDAQGRVVFAQVFRSI